MALIKTLMPNITDAALHKALMMRIPQERHHTLLTHDSELADTVFDSSDKAELPCVHKHKKTALSAQTNREKLSRGSKFLELLGHAPVPLAPQKSIAKATVCPKVTVYLHKIGLDRHALDKLLPPNVKGCRLQPVPEKKCITAYFPGALPASRTRTWGSLMPMSKCVRHVIEWTWQEHVKQKGKPCPWRLLTS